MTDTPSLGSVSPLDPDEIEFADLDGHTLDELSDYLERGRTPLDLSIENSPGCQLALEAMQRLRALSQTLLEADARADPLRDENWVTGILGRIARESSAGRDIPIAHPSPVAHLTLTEGAVRALIRRAGDEVEGVLVGRCQLIGDVTVPGEPISVLIDASVFWGERMPEVASSVRAAVSAELLKHTELNVVAIDITIHDVHVGRTDAPVDAGAAGDAGESEMQRESGAPDVDGSA